MRISKTEFTKSPESTKGNELLKSNYSFADIKGEPTAKRKAIIAAAGNHHIILMGPPGSGKSILERCIHALLPKSEVDDYIGPEGGPPWQAPHSSTGVAGLIGAWNKTRDVGVIPGRGVLPIKAYSSLTNGQNFLGRPWSRVVSLWKQGKLPCHGRQEA